MYKPYLDRFVAIDTAAVSDFGAVSRVPSCNPQGRHPLDGMKLPVISRRDSFVRLVVNAKSGKSGWFKLAELGKSEFVRLDAIPRGTHFNTDFRPQETEHRVYQSIEFKHKERNAVHTLLPKYRVHVIEQKGDFVQIAVGGDEYEAETIIGWTRLRTPKKVLTMWLWTPPYE
jgi:hypothetical protein